MYTHSFSNSQQNEEEDEEEVEEMKGVNKKELMREKWKTVKS
jgi:hypothetical protein